MKGKLNRRARRDAAHRQAGPTPGYPPRRVTELLLRLWTGDRIEESGGGLLVVCPAARDRPRPVATADLDALEYATPPLVAGVTVGRRVRLTAAGYDLLARWMGERHPDKRAVRSDLHDEILLLVRPKGVRA